MKRSLVLSSLLCSLLGGCWYKSFKLDPTLDSGGAGGSNSVGGMGGNIIGQGGTAPGVLAAIADTFTIEQGASLTAGNVLDNDTGVELTVSAFDDSDPSRPGSIDATSLEISADGSINFIPSPDFFGTYRVSYSVEDKSGNTATGSVEVVVRPKNIKLELIASGYGGFVVDGAIGDMLGSSVARAGDINKDGVEDFVVGAPNVAATGYAAIVYGRKVPQSFATSDPALTGKATILTGATLGQTGYSVAPAGDQNGDGSPDILVGSPGGVGSPGSVYVVYGKASLGTNLALTSLAASSGYRLDGWTSTLLGKVVAGGGDVNGDGKPDLVISGSHSRSLQDNNGSASVVFGPAAGGAIDPQIDLTINGKSSVRFGEDFALIDDLDGDGRDEVLAVGFGDVLVLNGLDPATDTPSAWPSDPTAMGAGKTTHGYRISSGAAGARVAAAGDFNKDGSADMVYCITTSSCSFLVGRTDMMLTTTWDINGLVSAPRVDGNGDLNGDGYSDFVLADTARAYVILGRDAVPTSALSVLSLTKNEYVIEAEASTSLGDVAFIGDVNDDGLDDLAVTAPARSSNAGRVYVILGQ